MYVGAISSMHCVVTKYYIVVEDLEEVSRIVVVICSVCRFSAFLSHPTVGWWGVNCLTKAASKMLSKNNANQNHVK